MRGLFFAWNAPLSRLMLVDWFQCIARARYDVGDS